jgi:uncharacterized membrane protein
MRVTHKGEIMNNKSRVFDLVSIAIVAALYVVLTITPPLNAISYGGVQFRLSEMLNFTAFFNRKYIIAVTIGCMIANFFSFTMVDVIVGGMQTLVFLTLGVLLFDRFKKQYFLNGTFNKAFVYFAVLFSLSMCIIAAELTLLAGAPFWLTYFTTFVGELASLLIGGFVIDKLSKRVDLTR